MSKHIDPVTGDAVTLPEYATIKAQGFIRRWTVFFVFVLGTVVCWIIGGPNILLWWNLSASAFAVVVELTIGMAQFSQTRRDAAILRELHEVMKEVRDYGRRDFQHSKDDLAVDLDSNQRLYAIESHLEKISKVIGLK
jgi:low affinity Fe/Cu permease